MKITYQAPHYADYSLGLFPLFLVPEERFRGKFDCGISQARSLHIARRIDQSYPRSSLKKRVMIVVTSSCEGLVDYAILAPIASDKQAI